MRCLTALPLLAPTLLAGLLATPAAAQRGELDIVRVKHLDPPQPTPLALDRAAITRADLRTGRAADGSLPAIMLTGYWPPTNEMLRRFSPDPVQNPLGWVGANWEGRGYDVYAYFPEFVPPNCSLCGKGSGDLEVDYQDTSADFWPLANDTTPAAVITFSRGNNDKSWEVEMNQFNRLSWIGDFLIPLQPTPAPPDASVPVDFLRPSALPVQAIVDAVDGNFGGMDAFICFTGDGGGFLSEFVAYHGVWYQGIHASPADLAWCVTAGHVHVGSQNSVARAKGATEQTLRVVIDHVDTITGGSTCQTDLGFGGPGSVTLTVCGDPLETGGTAELSLEGAPPSASAFFATALTNTPTPFKGGTLVPFPPLFVVNLVTDAQGAILIPGIQGGGGPATVTLQAVVVDAAQTHLFAFSNALALDVLP